MPAFAGFYGCSYCRGSPRQTARHIEACIDKARRATNASPHPWAFTFDVPNFRCAGVNQRPATPQVNLDRSRTNGSVGKKNPASGDSEVPGHARDCP
jgi:hypothetical protein